MRKPLSSFGGEVMFSVSSMLCLVPSSGGSPTFVRRLYSLRTAVVRPSFGGTRMWPESRQNRTVFFGKAGKVCSRILMMEREGENCFCFSSAWTWQGAETKKETAFKAEKYSSYIMLRKTKKPSPAKLLLRIVFVVSGSFS